MSIEQNIQTVKGFFAAMGGVDRQALLALTSEDIELDHSWQRLADGRHPPRARGIAEVARTASEKVGTSVMEHREYIAQGDRVLVIGFAKGKIKATNKTWVDDWALPSPFGTAS